MPKSVCLFSNGKRQGRTLLRELVERTTRTTAGQLSSVTSTMSLSELRGYVRARSWFVVHREILLRRECRQLCRNELEGLMEAVIERVVHRLANSLILSRMVRTWQESGQETDRESMPLREVSYWLLNRTESEQSAARSKQPFTTPKSFSRRAAA